MNKPLSSPSDSDSMTEFSSELYSIILEPPKKKSVSFSSIEIREFPIMLGDNPSASSGAPLTMEWNHQHSQVIKVDLFEFIRGTSSTRKEMRLSALKRKNMLQAAGYADVDIDAAAARAQADRLSREESSSKSRGCSAQSLVRRIFPKRKNSRYASANGFSMKLSRRSFQREQRLLTRRA